MSLRRHTSERMVGIFNWRNYILGENSLLHYMCLAANMCLAVDPGVTSLIPAQSHTFMEIDHEIISAVILPSIIYNFGLISPGTPCFPYQRVPTANL